MAANRILLATVVLAGLLALTVFQFNARDSEDDRASEVSAKLPKLKKDDIDELSIAAPEKPAVVLKKTDKTWSLTSPLTAAADSAAVDGALAKLEELEVTGVAATKADNYAVLEVDDKKAVHVTAKKAGKVVADLLIGTYRGGNTMVREQGAVNVATVKGSIKYAFEKDLKDWRDRLVVDVTADQVVSIKFENPKGTYTFLKEGSEWKQAPGAKPIANFDGGKIVSLVGTATSMRATDFAAADVTDDAAGVGAKPDGLVTLVTGGDAGEKTVLLRAGHKQGDGYYLRREGAAPLFIVSEFAGSRMLTGPDGFVKDEPKPAAAPELGSRASPIPVYPEARNPHSPH